MSLFACSCKNWDADEVFAYSTAKIVVVKDRYLGLLRILFLLGIFCYIIIYVLIVQKKYLELETPVGTTTTSLQKPPSVALNTSQYTYCNQYNATIYGHEPRYPYPHPCVVWDEFQTQYPADSQDGMFITTRFANYTQVYNCTDPSLPCQTPWVSTTPKVLYYVTAPEIFTVRLVHGMQCPQFYSETHSDAYAATSNEMSGKLEDRHGHVLQRFNSTSADIITLETILKAAGTHLDAFSTALGHDVNETQRNSGIILMFYISYSGEGHGRPDYTYTVSQIPQAEYKITETDMIQNPTGPPERLVVDRHGVKIVFIISGTLGRFSAQTALIQLVSALGLLSVATLVVEMLMLYIMPHRKYYNKYKFEETVDFSDVRDAENEVDTSKSADISFADDMHQNLASLRAVPLLRD